MAEDKLTAPMTPEQARSTLWPFREYRGQSIGSLLDSGQITLRDLGFAAERAWNRGVQDAAITLLLERLGQKLDEPLPAAGALNVVTTERRSFAERRQMYLMVWLGVALGVTFSILAIAVLYLLFMIFVFIPASNASPAELVQDSIRRTPGGVAGLVILIIVSVIAYRSIGFLADRAMEQWEKRMALYRKGQLGEERVLDMMYRVLDGNWWLFINLELPGRKTDLDMVLVGPTGVWVIEIKALQGRYRNKGNHWEYEGRRWWPTSFNPTKQVKRNAITLSHMLRSQRIEQWVSPALVWANPESEVVLEYPDVPVWTLEHLPEALPEALKQGRHIGEEQRSRVVEVLSELARRKD